jgi:hypothetical protein
MKKIIFLIAISFLCGTHIYGQKIILNDMSNGVYRIVTEPFELELVDEFKGSIHLYYDKETYEFIIELNGEKNKLHNFPEEAKLLFKTMDGSTIELKAFDTEIGKGMDYLQVPYKYPLAFYAISEQQLQSLFNGISKIRVEMLSYNKKEKTIFKDFQDIDYKNDKLGKLFNKMYNKLMAEKSKIDKQNAALLKRDASADF